MTGQADSTPATPAWKHSKNNRKRAAATLTLQYQSKITARQYIVSLRSWGSPNMASFMHSSHPHQYALKGPEFFSLV